MLSPIIYLAAGVLWNLEAKEEQNFGEREGVRLSFVRMDWPSRPINTRFEPLILVSIPLIVVAVFVIVAFVDWNFRIFSK
jgi:hypothetical protein